MTTQESQAKTLMTIVISIILSILFFWLILPEADESGKTLIEYLKNQNEELKKEIKSIQDSIKSVNVKIDSVANAEKRLSTEQSKIKTTIQNLKPKYEEAINRPANFTADSIRRYFSDL